MSIGLYLFIVVIFAACLHASFQLGVSLLTVLSGHSLSKQRSHLRLMHLNFWYVLGYAFMTFLLSIALVYFVIVLKADQSYIIGLVVASYSVLVGIWMSRYYFRDRNSTALWIPRGFARYLQERSSKTRAGSESFVLGCASILAELPFIIAPLSIAAIYIGRQSLNYQLLEILGYTIIATLPLLIIFVLIGGGHKISRIQSWREQNRRFLQQAAALGLIVLGICLFTVQINAISLGSNVL